MGGDVVLLLALLRVTADGQVAAFSGRCGKTEPCSCPYLRNPAARRHVIYPVNARFRVQYSDAISDEILG
jgi:hypothetical protein